MRKAQEAGFLTVAVTNRAQVAKGLVTLEELDRLFGRLEALLAEDGGVLDRIYFCPHHPDAGFPGEVPALKIRCECRKPGTLLFRRAIDELPIDKERSVGIGDSLRDIGAATTPFNAFQFLQGLETLPLRIRQHNTNAQAVAEFLQARSDVVRVIFPGFQKSEAARRARAYLRAGMAGWSDSSWLVARKPAGASSMP